MIARFLAVLFGIVSACAIAPLAAQGYPNKPIRIIVPWPPGGGVDVTLRAITPKLTETLGQPLVLDFRAGAAGIIGTEMAAKAAPDGYTLLGVFDNFPLAQYLFKKVPYDAIRDFAPIDLVIRGPMILVAPPQSGLKDLKQLLQLARSNAASFNYGSAGAGTSSHLAAELFKSSAGIEAEAVHHKGAAPAMTAVMGGHVQFMIVAAGTALSHVRSGTLVPLGVSAPKRIAQLPDVPAIAEFFPGFEAQSWIGMLAPAGTPGEVIRRLNSAIDRALADPEVRKRYENMGVEGVGGTPEAFAKWIAVESSKWGRVIRERGIALD